MLTALFPQSCALCRLPSRRDLPLCPDCEGDLPRNRSACSVCALPLPPTHDTIDDRVCGACLQEPPAYQRARVPWVYDEHFAFLIGRWKYQKQSHLARLFANLWLQEVNSLPAVEALVPVPLHWRRRWHRGFNQSEVLCEQLLAQRPGLGVLRPELARRKKHTRTQAGASARDRRVNLRDAFTVREDCDNLRVAIIDDVLTTGATVNALASALKNAGARHIEIWCIARTPA